MGTFHHYSHGLSIKSFTSLQMPLPQHYFFISLKKFIIAHATKFEKKPKTIIVGRVVASSSQPPQ
jgi:hypothetical protein